VDSIVKRKAHSPKKFPLPAANTNMTAANHTKLSLPLLVSLLVLLAVPTTSSGQSLGEVARRCRKERDTRAKKGETPAKVFTNDDLARMPPIAIVKSSEQAGPKAPASSHPPGATGGKAPAGPARQSGKAKTENGVKSKEYWQARFKAARARLAHAKEEQTLVEDELRLLQIQQARELNPDRSRKLNGRIDAANVELEAKRTATEKARQAMEKIEKEFKESGAPQDWIQKDTTADQ
jgi:hypothetical protein